MDETQPTSTPPHLLVVDDDAGIRDLLHDYLIKQGFSVDTARDGRDMALRLQATKPDLVVMDLMLPGDDGLALTRRIKAESGLPVIMLSARGEDIDRIVGLEVGADDYLAKPFNPRELLARIRAVLRRPSAAPAIRKAEANDHDTYTFGPFTLDRAAQRLLRNNQEIVLTHAEFTLLNIFTKPHLT